MTELDHPSAASQDPIRDYLRLFVKDDEDLLEHVLIVCFSSFSSNPLNLGVMAPSSEGKSYVVSLVADLFKRATHITGSSAKAFFYENGTYVEEVEGENGQKAYADLQGKVDQLKKRIVQDREDSSAREEFRALMSKALLKVNMDRRIIVFSEPPGAELFEALKPLLSHDKWESIYQTVDKAGSGELRTKKILLVGWPAFIFCSAKNLDAWSMWPEIQSRCVIVSPRMDESKYRHANDLTAKLLGLPSFALRQLFPPDLEIAAREAVRDVELSMDRMRLLGQSEGAGSKRDNFVFNPFADQLSELFPHEQGVMMRQFSYLMKYVNMLTLTRVAKRPKLIIRDQARASIATLEDVQNAIRLVSTSIWAAVPAYKLAFCTDVLESAFIQAGNSPVSTKLLLSVARSKGMKIGPDSLRKTYLVPLEEAGLAVSEVDPTDKRSLVWSPVQMPQKYGRLRDSTNFSLLSTKRSLKSCSDGIGDLVANFSYPDGRLVSDLDEFARFLHGPGFDDPATSPQPPGEPEPPAQPKGPGEIVRGGGAPADEGHAPAGEPKKTPGPLQGLTDATVCSECSEPVRPGGKGPFYMTKSGTPVCPSCFWKGRTPRKPRNMNGDEI